MIVSNVINRVIKEPELNDLIHIGSNTYKLVGFTNCGLRLILISPRFSKSIPEKINHNKNTFIKEYFFNGKDNRWNHIIKSNIPNFDYL